MNESSSLWRGKEVRKDKIVEDETEPLSLGDSPSSLITMGYSLILLSDFHSLLSIYSSPLKKSYTIPRSHYLPEYIISSAFKSSKCGSQICICSRV